MVTETTAFGQREFPTSRRIFFSLKVAFHVFMSTFLCCCCCCCCFFFTTRAGVYTIYFSPDKFSAQRTPASAPTIDVFRRTRKGLRYATNNFLCIYFFYWVFKESSPYWLPARSKGRLVHYVSIFLFSNCYPFLPSSERRWTRLTNRNARPSKPRRTEERNEKNKEISLKFL